MRQKRKILVIDDEDDICIFSKSILEKTGKFQVVFSNNARQGIELAKSERPELILLDIVMPDISGTEVAARLLENDETNGIPVVFLTCLAQEQDMKDESGIIGGRFFISKPVTAQELVDKVEHFFRLVDGQAIS